MLGYFVLVLNRVRVILPVFYLSLSACAEFYTIRQSRQEAVAFYKIQSIQSDTHSGK